jgi:hypothetical protein
VSPVCQVCPVIVRTEQWRPVPIPYVSRYGHQYAVSSHGRVANATMGKILATRVHATGYLVTSITRNPGTVFVHRLVALAFIGPPPRDGRAWEVDHRDFDRSCANVHTLRWLPKDTNAWRWKFWAQEEPPEWREEPPMTPDEFAEWCAQLKRNGWPDPPMPKPWDIHRHPVAS